MLGMYQVRLCGDGEPIMMVVVVMVIRRTMGTKGWRRTYLIKTRADIKADCDQCGEV